MSKWFVLAAMCVGGVAAAQDVDMDAPVVTRGGQGWSLYSGQTVGNGNNVIGAQIGWPGMSVEFLHGATSKFDIGAKLTPLNYGFESRVEDVIIGMKLQLVTRLNLIQSSKFNLGLEFDPGPLFYFPNRRSTIVGLALPLKVNAGIPVGSAIMVNFGMELPMFVVFGTGGGLFLPIMFGGGVEYYIDQRLNVAFNLKLGPSLFTRTGDARVAMDALIGVGYKF